MYAANVPDPRPASPPIDLIGPGRTVAWVVWGFAFAAAVVLQAWLGSFFLSLVLIYAVSFIRAFGIRRRGRAVMDSVQLGHPVGLKVALIGAPLQTIWSRPTASLTIADGRVALSGPDGFDVPAVQASFRKDRGLWRRGGILLERFGQPAQRFTLVSAFDPCALWAFWVIDHPSIPELEQARAATARLAAMRSGPPVAPWSAAVPMAGPGVPFVPPAPGAPERGSIVAGWYPDPAGSTQTRWWDGVGWTDHLR